MPWFKVDDNLAFNTKVVMAGNESMGLWVRAGSWSSAQLTDGYIPLPMAIAMATPMASAMANDMANPMTLIMRLVEAGLWHEVEGGFQFHDWDEYQPSAEEEKAKRKARSDAGKKGAAARWDGKSDGKSHSNSHGKSDGKNMPRPVPSRPPSSAPDDDDTKKGKHRLPDTWKPSESNRAYATEKGIDIDHEVEQFRNHHLAKGTLMLDWSRAFRTWLGNSATNFGRRPTQNVGNDTPDWMYGR